MRHTLYWDLMNNEFGSVRASSLHTDLALSSLGSITPAQAFEAGHGAKVVWEAVCEAADVPPERRLGPNAPLSRPF
ncbi:DUF3046 domain-containing protein [Brevibacterium litoralis]|uniref:DUF3046 domain-containing protein n=1 Tax=Brevibacterium litoralis TaxID=3138935 RepID=UPI0032ED8C83